MWSEINEGKKGKEILIIYFRRYSLINKTSQKLKAKEKKVGETLPFVEGHSLPLPLRREEGEEKDYGQKKGF
jgi:hypothetical protein